MSVSADVDREILKAAEKEFALNGFHDTVVRDIASRANVGKGTVYRHFGNKKQLFGSLVEHATEELYRELERINDQTKSSSDLLMEFVDAHFEFFETKRTLVEIIVKEGLEQTGEEMTSVVESWEDYRALMVDVFREGINSNPDWSLDDPEVGAQLFLGWIWGHLRDRIIFKFEKDPDVYKTHIKQFFLGGLQHDA